MCYPAFSRLFACPLSMYYMAMAVWPWPPCPGGACGRSAVSAVVQNQCEAPSCHTGFLVSVYGLRNIGGLQPRFNNLQRQEIGSQPPFLTIHFRSGNRFLKIKLQFSSPSQGSCFWRLPLKSLDILSAQGVPVFPPSASLH